MDQPWWGSSKTLRNELAIASRFADSLSIRGLLSYVLTKNTPDHSSLSVIRQRLSPEQVDALHLVLLGALRSQSLLKGRHLGIESSVLRANASLRELQQRNSKQKYWDCVKGLAAQTGVDPADTQAVRRFDKERKGRKASNAGWFNPHDFVAKVGRTKRGDTDMIYKPEHVSDLESGAISE